MICRMKKMWFLKISQIYQNILYGVKQMKNEKKKTTTKLQLNIFAENGYDGDRSIKRQISGQDDRGIEVTKRIYVPNPKIVVGLPH